PSSPTRRSSDLPFDCVEDQIADAAAGRAVVGVDDEARQFAAGLPSFKLNLERVAVHVAAGVFLDVDAADIDWVGIHHPPLLHDLEAAAAERLLDELGAGLALAAATARDDGGRGLIGGATPVPKTVPPS